MVSEFIVLTCPGCRRRVKCATKHMDSVLQGKAKCPDCRTQLQFTRDAIAEVGDDTTVGDDIDLGHNSLLKVKKTKDIAVAAVTVASLRESSETAQLLEELNELINTHGLTKISLNLENVQLMGSSAINALVTFNMKIRKEGGEIKLCHVGHRIRKAFRIMRLTEAIDIHKNEIDSVKALRSRHEEP